MYNQWLANENTRNINRFESNNRYNLPNQLQLEQQRHWFCGTCLQSAQVTRILKILRREQQSVLSNFSWRKEHRVNRGKQEVDLQLHVTMAYLLQIKWTTIIRKQKVREMEQQPKLGWILSILSKPIAWTKLILFHVWPNICQVSGLQNNRTGLHIQMVETFLHSL